MSKRHQDSFSVFIGLYALGNRIALHQQYLEDLENFLESEKQQYQEDLEKVPPVDIRLVDIIPVDDEFKEEMYQQAHAQHYYEDKLEALDEFARMLRKSFFVSLYTFLESQFNEECRARRQEKNTQLVLSDISGSGIGRAKKYLAKVLEVDFPFASSLEWQEIRKYQQVRNCMVHSDGALEGMGQDKIDKLKQYIDSKPTLSLSGNRIMIHSGFCEEALQTIGRFLLLLHSHDIQEQQPASKEDF